jgi:hypothetical protein
MKGAEISGLEAGKGNPFGLSLSKPSLSPVQGLKKGRKALRQAQGERFR